MNRLITTRQAEQLQQAHRKYRLGKMDRDYQLELLLTAGVAMLEARLVVDGMAPA